MAPVVTPPVRVSAPPPGDHRYGIFNVADVVPFTDDHQHYGGLLYDAAGCGTARGWPIACDVATPGTPKTFDNNTAETSVKPFAVYTSLLCGTAGYTAEYLEDKVRMRLAAVEQQGVEEAFSSGLLNGTTLGNTPVLAGGGGVTVLTAAGSLKLAVAALEEFAGDNYGYVPVIHAPASVAAHAGANGLIRAQGDIPANGVLKTYLGSRWSFGSGYTNTSPVGVAAAAGHAWLYVTGRVTLWQNTNVFVSPAKQSANRAVNQYNLIAEREWAASFDCFVAAIDVTL
jgi:hypothetical protein